MNLVYLCLTLSAKYYIVPVSMKRNVIITNFLNNNNRTAAAEPALRV